MNNGYNQKMVNRLIKRKRDKNVNALIFKGTGTTNTDKNWMAIPCTEIVLEIISRIIQKREKTRGLEQLKSKCTNKHAHLIK